MFWFQTISKVLVWLLVALVPIQGLPSTACGCEAPVRTATDLSRPSEGPPTCCCLRQASPPAATHACCQRTDQDIQRTCGCGAGCLCKKSDSTPPRPEQIPSEHRTQANDLSASPLVIFCLEAGDPEPRETEGRKVLSLSSAERCVLLGRFDL